MKQPKLGQKIAELRIAAQMTQTELAEKCNLSLRTIQRIETGVVNPRSFSVKTIFAVLDYDISELNVNERFDKESASFNGKLKKIYAYIIELFNLKTETMKKLSILTLTFTILGVGLFSLTSKAQKENASEYLICNSRDIVYLFPKGQKFFLSNMKDTADIKLENSLIQEFENNIYLNGLYQGRAFPFDTVKFENNNLSIISSYTPYTSSYGQEIVYLFPKGKFIDNTSVQIDTEFINFGEYEIREHKNKIYLNDIFQGEAFAGDTVVFRDSVLYIFK